MFRIPAQYREWVYTAQLGIAVVLALLVSFGVITLDQINGWVLAAIAIFAMLEPLLALFHITPDVPPTEG